MSTQLLTEARRPRLLVWWEMGAPDPAHLLDDRGRMPATKVTQGPGGPMGTLATPAAGLWDLQYEPDRQRWIRPARAGDGKEGAYHVGVDPAGEWDPGMVARRDLVPGHVVKLGDGNLWTIPVARMAMGGVGLPRRRGYDADGRKTWVVDEALQDLVDFARTAWAARNGEAVAVSEDQLDAMAAAALGVNYRMGEAEAVALGLFTDSGLRAIVDALLDWPTVLQLIEAQKKT